MEKTMLKIVLNSVLLTSYPTVPHPHSQNHNLPDSHWEIRNALLLTQIHPIEFLCSGIWPQNCPFKQYLFTLEEGKKSHPELDHGDTVWGVELLYLVVATDKGECSGKQRNVEGLSIFCTKEKAALRYIQPLLQRDC